MIKTFISKTSIFFLLIFCLPFNANGYSYEYFSNGYFTSIHVLIVNPNEHAIIPVKSADSGESGRETVLTLSRRHGAVAAVNGGFWKANGNPAGILKINRHWFGTPIKPRGAIGWSLKDQKVLIDRLLTNYQLNNCPDESVIEVIPMSIPPSPNLKSGKILNILLAAFQS